MKNFQSLVEGSWVQLLPVNLTDEQKTLIMSTKEEDKEVKKSLMENIKSEKELAVEASKLNELVAYYDNLKLALELKPEDVYSLISVNIAEVGAGEYRGIVNYRVGKEHKQYRFPKSEITTFKF